LKKHAAQWKVLQAWTQIVGEAVAKVSQPKSVFSGTLIVATSSSPWANELTFRTQEILALIREHLGETGIRSIRFQSTSWKEDRKGSNRPQSSKLSPEQKERITQLSQRIENPSLKKIFERVLGKALGAPKYHF